MEQTGVRENTNEVVLVDSGALHFSNADKAIGELSLSDFSLMGALEGAATFEVDTTNRDIEYSGVKGPVKGGVVKEEIQAMISGSLKEHTLENYLKTLPGAYTSDWPDSSPSHDLIERQCNIALSDYVNYIALVGYLGEECSVGSSGEPIIFLLKNALNKSTVSIELEDGSEGVLPVEFYGHYDQSDLDTEPWAIAHPSDVTTPLLSTEGELVEGSTNPTLTFDLSYETFVGETEAENSSNWNLVDDVDSDGATGLTIGTIYYHDEDNVTIEFDSTGATDGTTDLGSISVQVTAAALSGSQDSNVLKISTVA